ncbi:MAG: heterodisulfide reductase-related iron-sulfur binding cluster, partial [Cycloclasticus sp.]
VQSKGTDIVELLNNISELDIRSFNTDQMCCGAAGTQMLTHKKTAQTLRKQTLVPVKQRPTDYLLSSNIGCALHLSAGLKSEGLNSQVLHPVSLLSQQLKV